MNLFRRLLLTLFPSSMQTETVNPIRMFIGFIAPKQFFSAVHRKIFDHFALNLFDIGIESFEMSLGLNDSTSLPTKQEESYYSYVNAAYLNGWTAFTPSTIGVHLTIYLVYVFRDHLHTYNDEFVEEFAFMLSLLPYIFAARVKVFPDLPDNERLQWFLELCTQIVIEVGEGAVSPEDARTCVSALPKLSLEGVMLLYHSMVLCNDLYKNPTNSSHDIHQWMFQSIQGHQERIQDFLQSDEQDMYVPAISAVEKDIIVLLAPSEFLQSYALQAQYWYTIADTVFHEMYEHHPVKNLLRTALQGPKGAEQILRSLTDVRQFKEHFFGGLKKATSKLFTMKRDYKTRKEIDEFLSTIEEKGSSEGVNIPPQIKQESALMDRMFNFYLTFVGSTWAAKGDTFALRLFEKPLLNALVEQVEQYANHQDGLQYYGSLLYTYSKNVVGYSYAYKNVRAGKESFTIPLNPRFKEVYANMYLLSLFGEYFIASVLQDLNTNTLPITISHDDLVQQFKTVGKKDIETMAALEGEDLLHVFYKPACALLRGGDGMLDMIAGSLGGEWSSALKENIYSPDCLMRYQWTVVVGGAGLALGESYGDKAILGILSMARETVFGLMLFYHSLLRNDSVSDKEARTVMMARAVDCLLLTKPFANRVVGVTKVMYVGRVPLLEQRLGLDDNREFMKILTQLWTSHSDGKTMHQAIDSISGDDAIRLRGVLKTVTYYNKRFIKPKSIL